jgi:hypothetical protein
MQRNATSSLMVKSSSKKSKKQLGKLVFSVFTYLFYKSEKLSLLALKRLQLLRSSRVDGVSHWGILTEKKLDQDFLERESVNCTRQI